MTRSVYSSPSADVCCIELNMQKETFLEEFKPQIKEAWLSRGERALGFGLEREGPRRKGGTLARQCHGAAISKLEQATRRGAFQECLQQWEK